MSISVDGPAIFLVETPDISQGAAELPPRLLIRLGGSRIVVAQEDKPVLAMVADKRRVATVLPFLIAS